MDSHLPLEDRIVAAIRQIIRAVDLHSRRLVEVYGMTGPQLAVLQEVRRLGPVSSGALARAVHLSHPTVTGILTRLESRGFVVRRRGESDRRTVNVHLTTTGRTVLANAPSLLQDRFRSELEHLEEWERLMTLTVLQRVAAMMGAEGLDAAPLLESGAALAPTDAGLDELRPVDPGPEAAAPRARRGRGRRRPRRKAPSPPCGPPDPEGQA